MALAPRNQTLLITASGVAIALATPVTVPGIIEGPSPSLTLSASIVQIEGDSGTTAISTTAAVDRDGATGALVVNLTYGGTVTSGVDYEAGPATVTIPADQDSVSWSRNLIADTVDEANETLIINAVLAGYPSATATRTITISDDDGPDTSILLVVGDSLTKAAGANGFAAQLVAGKPSGTTILVNAENSRTVGGPALGGEGPDLGSPPGTGNTLLLQRDADLATDAATIMATIGTNDLTGFSVSYYVANLVNWSTPIRASGRKIIWSAPPPLSSTQAFASYAAFMAKRATLMADARNPTFWGQFADGYSPIGECPALNRADNSAFYSPDGVHPNEAGQNEMFATAKPIADSSLDQSRAGSTEVYPGVWPTGATGLQTSAVITRRFTVSGLDPAGTALGATIVSGPAELRLNEKGAWAAALGTGSGNGWRIYNGDAIELRVTTSGSADTPVSIDLKIGSETKTLIFRTAAGQSAQQVTIGPAGVFNANPAGGLSQSANIVLNADGALTVFVDDFEDRGNATVTYAGAVLTKRGVTINGSSIYTGEIGGSGIAKSAVARALTVTMGSGSNANRTVVSYCLALGADPVPTATATTNVNASGAFQAESNTLTRQPLGVLIGTLASSVGDHSAFGGTPQHATAFGDTQFLASGGGVVFQGESHMATLGYEATGTEIKLQFTPTAEGPQVGGNPLTQRPVQAIMLNAKGA